MNRANNNDALELGPDVVKHLLPIRRPLLLVDGVRRYLRAGDRVELWARRQISANEEVFAGHFPGLHLWPGIYTIEGLGQSCFVLEALLTMQNEWERQGGDPEEVLAALRNLELGYRLSPKYRPRASALLERLRKLDNRVGLSASVEMRFLQPVFGGQRLDYRVTRTHALEQFTRFEIEASVDDRAVARGVMTSAVSVRPDAAPSRAEALPPEARG